MSVPRPLFSAPFRDATGTSRAHSIRQRALDAQLQPVPDSREEDAAIPTGRRGAPRLRLSLPAKLVSLYGTHRCILIDLSRTGAQVGLEKTLAVNETGFLQIAGLELFCEVVRTAEGPSGGVNGLVFDPPLDDQVVLDMRSYGDNYDEDDLRGLRDEVKDWVNGVI